MTDPDTVPEPDPELLYEECHDCPPDGFCVVCWDFGLVEHTGCMEYA